MNPLRFIGYGKGQGELKEKGSSEDKASYLAGISGRLASLRVSAPPW